MHPVGNDIISSATFYSGDRYDQRLEGIRFTRYDLLDFGDHGTGGRNRVDTFRGLGRMGGYAGDDNIENIAGERIGARAYGDDARRRIGIDVDADGAIDVIEKPLFDNPSAA